MLQAHNYVSSVIRLKGKECKRMPMHFLLKNLVSWQPLSDPAPGYTVVIAAMGALAPLAIANLRLAARQSCAQMRELILIIDRPADRIPQSIREAARECSQFIRIRVLGYNRWQDFVARQINWGWVYSWMSWSLAIAHSTTRAVIIHDLDALPIHPRLFESLYDNWLHERADFCGISQYSGNGVTAEMNLLKTCDLTVDAAYLRQRFRPFDLFNKLRLIDGRLVDFDTMLHVQMQSRRSAHFNVHETQLVHPSGVVCQYTDFVAGRTAFKGKCHNLLMLPYFAYLGGDSSMLAAVGRQVDRINTSKIRLLGRELYIDAIPPKHWAWMEKQVRRLEHAVFGGTRPEVAGYLAGFILRSGESRTVGRENSLTAVENS